jgi:hypothetical protein
METLYRGLADNSVGKVIETLLRNELIICDEGGFAPLDSTGSQLLFRFVAAVYERRSLAIASPLGLRRMGPVPARPQHRRQPPRPAPAAQQRRRHRRRELPDARSPHPTRRPPLDALTTHARWGASLATSGDRDLALDRTSRYLSRDAASAEST